MNTNTYTFKILSCFVKKQEDAINLNWLQKLACRILKITPERLYWYELEITTNPENYLYYYDGLISIDGNKWVVLNNSDFKYIILNREPLKDFTILGDAILAYRAIGEK